MSYIRKKPGYEVALDKMKEVAKNFDPKDDNVDTEGSMCHLKAAGDILADGYIPYDKKSGIIDVLGVISETLKDKVPGGVLDWLDSVAESVSVQNPEEKWAGTFVVTGITRETADGTGSLHLRGATGSSLFAIVFIKHSQDTYHPTVEVRKDLGECSREEAINQFHSFPG